MALSLEKQITQGGGSVFQKKVWCGLLTIPRGSVITYRKLAQRIGAPSAVRAVATAVGKNPYAPKVPCHRVIRSDGTLGGYSGQGGVAEKARLLRSEGAQVATS